ncbi:unnamed protein product [Mytilus edulis]|uniref:Uncharacterized protein n=1 Tax=Mytilus edulis TaxID=6550 RepID=A0A8S3T1X8_MYTED|nr:unnamed protein product [Mytilus edulis]
MYNITSKTVLVEDHQHNFWRSRGTQTTHCNLQVQIELKDLCANHPQFLKYYEQSFKPRVQEFVNAPNRRLGTKHMWTNNNAESMNRVMKVAVNWKPQHAPDLVDKLFDMVDFQFINLRSALHHSGDYMLVNSYKQYTIADAIWKTKSDEEKRKLFNSFLQDNKKRKHENINNFIRWTLLCCQQG